MSSNNNFLPSTTALSLLLLFGMLSSLLPSSSALHIAHVAGLNVKVPTNGVGGLEKVVEVLIFEQLKAGHTITLFCTEDSGKLMEFKKSYEIDVKTIKDKSLLEQAVKENAHLEQAIKNNFNLVSSGRPSLNIHTRNYAEYMDEINDTEKLGFNYKEYIEAFLAKILDHVENPKVADLKNPKKWEEPIDIVHFHSMDHFEYDGQILHKPLINARTITTMHMSLEDKRVTDMLIKYPQAQLVSISKDQQTHLDSKVKAKFIANVYNAYPKNLYTPNEDNKAHPDILSWNPKYDFGTQSKENTPYLAFIGRFSSDKGAHNAIKIALKAGVELRIAAKITPHEKEYRDTLKALVKELLPEGAENKLIKFIGEVKGDVQKKEFLRNATAMLFPIEWQEPFGLVMIESMACGTPVIAPKTASVPEIIQDGAGLKFDVKTKVDENGETRVVYDDDVISAAAALVPLAKNMDRKAVRQVFDAHFTGPVMLDAYKDIYTNLIKQSPEPIGKLKEKSSSRGHRVGGAGHSNGADKHAENGDNGAGDEPPKMAKQRSVKNPGQSSNGLHVAVGNGNHHVLSGAGDEQGNSSKGGGHHRIM